MLELLRKSIKFKNWRTAVFNRDGYTCRNCGDRSRMRHRIELHPHHIKSFANYPRLRFSIKNGKTLCCECHGKVHGKKFFTGKKAVKEKV